MSKREQIIVAVVRALSGTKAVGSRIFRSREDALAADEAPALAIYPETEEQVEANIQNIEAKLQFVVEVYARAIASPDKTADATAESVHAKLMLEPTLGGLAIDLSEAGTEWDFDQADQTVVLVRMHFVAWYRRARNSLS